MAVQPWAAGESLAFQDFYHQPPLVCCTGVTKMAPERVCGIPQGMRREIRCTNSIFWSGFFVGKRENNGKTSFWMDLFTAYVYKGNGPGFRELLSLALRCDAVTHRIQSGKISEEATFQFKWDPAARRLCGLRTSSPTPASHAVCET